MVLASSGQGVDCQKILHRGRMGRCSLERFSRLGNQTRLSEVRNTTLDHGGGCVQQGIGEVQHAALGCSTC
jgi:hypothetical protein